MTLKVTLTDEDEEEDDEAKKQTEELQQEASKVESVEARSSLGSRWIVWKRRKFRAKSGSYTRRPSVAFADYEIPDTRASAMSSLLLLFAIFEGMSGFVLPICNAFSKGAHYLKYYYYEQFLIFQYSLSILALCYLQALIFYYDQKENLRNKYYRRFEKHLRKLSSESLEGRNRDLPPRPLGVNSHPDLVSSTGEHKSLFTLSTPQTRSAESLNNIQPTNTPRVTFMSTHASSADNVVTKSSAEANIGRDPNDPTAVVSSSTRYSRAEDLLDLNQAVMNRSAQRFDRLVPLQFIFGDCREDHHSARWKDAYISRDSEGVNLYLRLGAVGFGFGVMIFDGFKIAAPWEAALNNVHSCHSSLWISVHILHFIYVFWQTYFLFKHHQVVFNVQKFILRFLLCHLAVANLCQWLKTIVDEISDEPHNATAAHSPLLMATTTMASHLIQLSDNQTAAMHQAREEFMEIAATKLTPNNSCKSTAKDLAPFLFPCAIEYSLIAGAIFYKMFQKVGQVHKESERRKRMRQANTVTGRFAECHRSHKGLFIGLLLFMATLVTMCLFFIFFAKRNKRSTAITLYQSTELILLFVSMLTCVASLIRLRVLHLSNLSEEGAFDDNLLLIGLIGMIFYDLFLLVPALEAIPTRKLTAILFAAKAIMEILQSMIQVFFILEASRRSAGSLDHVRRKPGRTLITFLLILNLAMWFVNTFEVKRADHNSIHIDYYTEMAWKIITHIALPMIVFFRFHSTVCLSDIWANAYRFRTD